MNYLEIIELRSGNKNIKLIGPEITELINELNQSLEKSVIKLFINATVENDFSIHIRHESDDVAIHGSPIGSLLISILKESGLTYHSIWVEKI